MAEAVLPGFHLSALGVLGALGALGERNISLTRPDALGQDRAMPYSVLVTLILLIIVVRFVAIADVSVAAKAFVAGVLLVSLVVQFAFAQWGLVALLLQAALGIALVFHARAAGSTPL